MKLKMKCIFKWKPNANSEKQVKPQESKKLKGGIVAQISIAFVIPILFVVIIGTLSYMQAEKGLREKYEEAALTTIKMTNQYVDLGLKLAESEALKYAYDTSMNEYYMGLYEKNNAKKSQAINTMKSGMKSTKNTNAFISEIHIVTKSDVTMQTTKQINKGTGAGFYEDMSDEIEQNYGSNINSAWLNYHALLDERLEITQDDYILSYYCTSTNSTAGIVVDVSKETIANAISSMNMGTGNTVGFITSQGREIVSGENTNFTLVNKDYYTNFLNSDATDITTYINEGGRKYLLLASKSSIADSIIYAVVPKDVVVEKANDIRTITILLVVLSCIIAIIIATIISLRINHRMTVISQGLNRASQGDLTTVVSVKGNDEFTSIGQSITRMIEHMHTLVHDSKENVTHVAETVEEVKNTSNIVNNHSGNINRVIEQINVDMCEQKESADQCQQKMDTLSDEIKTMVKEIEKIETFAVSSHEMIKNGVNQMNFLSTSSDSTSQITEKVIDNINELSSKTKAIEEFIDIINGISAQTNLLSLNASIEAARAGSAGRGFSVGAEEIRQLGEDSLHDAIQIQATVTKIQTQVKETSENAKTAEEIVNEQGTTVNAMNEIFEKMSLGMTELLTSVDQISKNVEQVDSDRHSTKNAVTRITEVINNTSSSASTVGVLANELLTNVEMMNSISDELMNHTNDLKEEMEHFIIS